MSWISILCLSIFIGIILSFLRRGADPLSPARLFGLVWSLSIALTDLKLSAYQHDWNFFSWILLLTGLSGFLVGTFIAYVLYLDKELLPISGLRKRLREEVVHGDRLFALICLSFSVYAFAYLANFLIKGWLPVFTVGTELTRVEYNVYGLTLLLYSVPFIILFAVLYHLFVPGRKKEKIVLKIILSITIVSNLLLLSRFQLVMTIIICSTFLYYATKFIRLRTAVIISLTMTGFFYWISSIRVSRYVSAYIYSVSRLKFSKEYAFLAEPYMYVVMNLENFARSVNLSDYHTYGYFTFDFIAAMTGLKYWALEYFNLDRMPFLTSSYNTYTAFWWFYSDFGIIGLVLIPGTLGLGTALLYYRMRINPGIKNVVAYGVMVFVMFISYFNFPISFLWFEYIMLVIYLVLRWTVVPRTRNAAGTLY